MGSIPRPLERSSSSPAAMAIPLDKAELVALFLESVLYGVFCVTFIACLYILLYKRRTRQPNWPMLVTAVLLWIFASMHISIDLRRVLDAFYTFRDAPGGPVAYLGKISELTHVMKSAVYITHTCISDALVVYRCHAILRNSVVTLFLTLMVIGSAVAGYGSIYMLVHTPPFQGSIFNTALAPWITSFNVITAATNILATVLIAWNIWSVSHRVSGLIGSSSLSPVVLILVESGAIYAFSLLLLTAFYTSDSNAQFIVLDAVTPIIGIVFCLIIIQIGLRRDFPTTYTETWLWTSPNINYSEQNETSQYASCRDTFRSGHIALTPIAVNVTTDVHDDSYDNRSEKSTKSANRF